MALTTNPAPLVLSQPVSLTRLDGSSANFSVIAGGPCPLRYQWAFNGVDIAGATNSDYHVPRSLEYSDAGVYTVRISNEYGWVESAAADLTVTDVQLRQLGAFESVGAINAPRPGSLGQVSSISAGLNHVVALRADGTVVAWGADFYGQCRPPSDLNAVTKVAAGGTHSLALRDDGTLVSWGSNHYGQTSIPEGLQGVVAIAAGRFHNLSVREDGSVAWGNPDRGATAVPNGLNRVIAAAAGLDHSAVLRSDGTVVAWGYDAYGQAQPPAGLSEVTAIAAGFHHTLALKKNGAVIGWGRNHFGQAQPPEDLSEVAAIAAGYSFSIALTREGKTVGWGAFASLPPLPLSGIVAIGAGHYHSMAVAGPPAPQVLIDRQTGSSLTLSLGITPGWPYQLEESVDYLNWMPSGEKFLGAEGVMAREIRAIACLSTFD